MRDLNEQMEQNCFRSLSIFLFFEILDCFFPGILSFLFLLPNYLLVTEPWAIHPLTLSHAPSMNCKLWHVSQHDYVNYTDYSVADITRCVHCQL